MKTMTSLLEYLINKININFINKIFLLILINLSDFILHLYNIKIYL